ncbi:MAG: carboxypeptidase-like regulatory domain-containing protein [Acidobacteriota bacterium]
MRLVIPILVSAGVLAVALQAQTAEIRGVVQEYGSNTPIAGAQVTLSEFVVVDNNVVRKEILSAFSGNNGEYSFKPGSLGRFYVDVSKDGYFGMASLMQGADIFPGGGDGRPVDVTAAKPVADEGFTLVRPGTLTGRVVDENGKAMAGLRVGLVPPPQVFAPLGLNAVTGADGGFTFTKLVPGAYVVRTGSTTGDYPTAIEYTEAAAKIVDQDLETSYWPGGTRDAKSALPVQVVPSAPSNVGTLRVRKVPYYRVQLTSTVNCAANDTWSSLLFDPEDTNPAFRYEVRPCRKTTLLRNVRPGTYEFAAWSGKLGESGEWTLAPIVVTNRNITVPLIFSPSVDVPIQVSMNDAKPLPAFNGLRVFLRPPEMGLPADRGALPVDGNGGLVVSGMKWPRQTLSVQGLPGAFFIKELRYNRTVLSSTTFQVIPSATLEIILEDNAASLAATVTDRERPVVGAVVILAKWPLAEPLTRVGTNAPFVFYGNTDTQGRLQLSGLGPGEYRVGAVPREAATAEVLERLVRNGEKLTLGRGVQHTLQLKLTDPR